MPRGGSGSSLGLHSRNSNLANQLRSWPVTMLCDYNRRGHTAARSSIQHMPLLRGPPRSRRCATGCTFLVSRLQHIATVISFSFSSTHTPPCGLLTSLRHPLRPMRPLGQQVVVRSNHLLLGALRPLVPSQAGLKARPVGVAQALIEGGIKHLQGGGGLNCMLYAPPLPLPSPLYAPSPRLSPELLPASLPSVPQPQHVSGVFEHGR